MWFPYILSFLCSEIHFLKRAKLLFRNNFLKNSHFLFFKYIALYHTHFQYENSLYFTPYWRYWAVFTINTKFTANHKALRLFFIPSNKCLGPHIVHSMCMLLLTYIVDQLGNLSMNCPNSSVQILHEVWTWHWHEVSLFLFLALYSPLRLLVRIGFGGELRTYKSKN